MEENDIKKEKVTEKWEEVEELNVPWLRGGKRKKGFLHSRWATFGEEIENLKIGRGCDFLSLG